VSHCGMERESSTAKGEEDNNKKKHTPTGEMTDSCSLFEKKVRTWVKSRGEKKKERKNVRNIQEYGASGRDSVETQHEVKGIE